MSWQASTPNSKRFWSRRDCLTRSGSGFGLLGLAALLGDVGALATPERDDSSALPRHGPVARAKSVIWCFMYGGPSGIDLFDHKPDLEKYHGRPFDGAAELQTFSGKVGPLMRPPFGFQRYGECGQTVSELYPNIARHVDSIAFLKACHVETNVHDQALFQVNTGMTRLGFPQRRLMDHVRARKREPESSRLHRHVRSARNPGWRGLRCGPRASCRAFTGGLCSAPAPVQFSISSDRPR